MVKSQDTYLASIRKRKWLQAYFMSMTVTTKRTAEDIILLRISRHHIKWHWHSIMKQYIFIKEINVAKSVRNGDIHSKLMEIYISEYHFPSRLNKKLNKTGLHGHRSAEKFIDTNYITTESKRLPVVSSNCHLLCIKGLILQSYGAHLKFCFTKKGNMSTN